MPKEQDYIKYIEYFNVLLKYNNIFSSQLLKWVNFFGKADIKTLATQNPNGLKEFIGWTKNSEKYFNSTVAKMNLLKISGLLQDKEDKNTLDVIIKNLSDISKKLNSMGKNLINIDYSYFVNAIRAINYSINILDMRLSKFLRFQSSGT